MHIQVRAYTLPIHALARAHTATECKMTPRRMHGTRDNTRTPSEAHPCTRCCVGCEDRMICTWPQGCRAPCSHHARVSYGAHTSCCAGILSNIGMVHQINGDDPQAREKYLQASVLFGAVFGRFFGRFWPFHALGCWGPCHMYMARDYPLLEFTGHVPYHEPTPACLPAYLPTCKRGCEGEGEGQNTPICV